MTRPPTRRYAPHATGPIPWAVYLAYLRFRNGETHRLQVCRDCGSVFPEHRCTLSLSEGPDHCGAVLR